MANKENTIIEITETGLARLVTRRSFPAKDGQEAHDRIIEDRSVDASALMPERGSLSLLPPNCRFQREEGPVQVFVIEDAPATRTVRWHTQNTATYEAMHIRLLSGGNHHLWGEAPYVFEQRLRNQQAFTLAFPYIVKIYVFADGQFEQVTMWYRNKPLTTERDELFVPNLPNRSAESHRLCITDYSKALRNEGSMADLIRKVETEFWGSPWNSDWTENFMLYGKHHPELASPWEWERMSRINPLFALSMPWMSGERTIADEVTRLLRTSVPSPDENAKRAYLFMEKQIRLSEPWDGSPRPAKAVDTISPAKYLLLHHQVLSVGDELVFDRALVSGMRSGQPYKIEWFGRVFKGGRRLVKLEGLNEAAPLISQNVLEFGEVRNLAPGEAQVTLSDQVITPGTLLRFTSRQSWPGRDNTFRRIKRILLGHRGMVQAQLGNEPFLTIIGQGDTLYSDIQLHPAEEINGEYTSANSVTLPDGTVLTVGDTIRYFSERGGSIQKDVIHAFYKLESRAKRIIRLRSNSPISCLDDSGNLPQLVFPAGKETPVTELTLTDSSSRPLCLKAGMHLLYRGNIFTIRSFSPLLEGGHHAEFEGNTQGLRISNGLRFVEGLIQIAPELEVTTDRKQCRLEHQVYRADDLFFDYKTKTFFQIKEFQKAGVGRVDAYRPSGDRINFIIGFAPCSKSWERVQVMHRMRSGLILRRLQTIRLRQDTPEFKQGKRFLISHFVRDSKRSYRVSIVTTTGVIIRLNDGLLDVRINGQWQPITHRETVVVPSQPFARFPVRRPVSQALKASCVKAPGTAIDINDHDGRAICYGDRVQAIMEMTAHCERTSKHGVEILKTGAFPVVHYGVNGSVGWLYLDAGMDIQVILPITENTVGYSMLPEKFRKDSAWLSRIIFVRADRCRIASSSS